MRLLLAEDEAHAGEYLVKGLGENGFTVDWVRNGTDALHHATTSAYDLIVLDIGLPGMDGYEVARTIRADESHSGMLLVAVTGYGSPEARARAHEAGFDRHLVKPVTPEEFLGILE